MALAIKTTRDSDGAAFPVAFEDIGGANYAYHVIANADGSLVGDAAPLAVYIASDVSASFDTFPGLTDQELRSTPVDVRDGSTAYAFTNRSLTSTGAAQSVAANSLRRFIQVQNTSDTDWWYSYLTGVTATVGGSGCFKLTPGSQVSFEGAACARGAWSFLCAASSKALAVVEGI